MRLLIDCVRTRDKGADVLLSSHPRWSFEASGVGFVFQIAFVWPSLAVCIRGHGALQQLCCFLAAIWIGYTSGNAMDVEIIGAMISSDDVTALLTGMEIIWSRDMVTFTTQWILSRVISTAVRWTL